MRLDHLTIRGLTSAGEIAIDFRDIPPGIIAVVGPNGAGKTTLLESPAAAWYRRFPTRGKLPPFVRDEAEIDVTAQHNGQAVRAVLSINGPRNTQTGAIYVDGGEVTDGQGGVRSYDAAVKELLPSFDLFRAAAFAAQDGGGSFASADQKDRRALLRQALGLARWQRTHEKAREAGLVIDRRLQRVRDRNDNVDEHRERLELAQTRATDARKALDEAASDAQAAQVARDTAQARHAAAEQALADVTERQRAWDRRQGQLVAEEAEAIRHHRDAAVKLADTERAARDLSSLREQQQQREAAEQELRDADTALAEAQTAEAQLGREVATARANYTDAARVREAAHTGVQLAEQAQARIPQLQEQVGQLARLREQMEGAEADVAARADARQRLAEVDACLTSGEQKRQRLVDEMDRANRDAQLLDRVPCGGGTCGDVDCSGCPLLTNATAARDRSPQLQAGIAAIDAERPRHEAERADLQAAVQRADEARDRAAAIRVELAQLGNVDEHLREANRHADALPDARTAAADADKLVAGIIAEGQALKAKLEAAEATRFGAEAVSAGVRQKLHELPDVSSQLRTAQTAADQLELLQSAAERAQTTMERAKAARVEHEQTPRPSTDAARTAEREAADALAPKESALRVAQRTERTHAEEVAAADAEARVAQESIDSIERALAGLKPLEQRRAGLHVLEQAAGPTGVQALEMDAAGPGISDCVNTILDVAYGGRFSVQLVTQAMKADGKGRKEICDVEVTDALKDWRGPIGAASGGEQVVLEAALRLGIGAYLRGQGGDWRTVWLDEADGALDATMKLCWPEMVRAAATMSGAHHILMVSHTESVWRQADTLIVLDGDGATVCDPAEFCGVGRVA